MRLKRLGIQMVLPILDLATASTYSLAEGLVGAVSVGGLRLLDLRRADAAEEFRLLESLGRALEYVDEAGEFGTLVKDELKLIVAVPHRSDSVNTACRAYCSPFRRHTRSSSFYLACRLVWAATWIRRTRAANLEERAQHYEAFGLEALEAQVRFAALFDDAVNWEGFLRASFRGIHGDTNA